MIEKKPYHTNNTAWIWARIRAIRNYRAEIDFIEASLMELKRLVELANRNQPASDPPATTIEREPAGWER